MRILAIERELASPGQAGLRELLRDEARAVWELQKSGVIRDIWFTASDRRAILMLECANAATAREHLDKLPLVRRGCSDFSVLELHSYDGFERLFTGDALKPAAKPEEPPEY
jgi:hypothetical protein